MLFYKGNISINAPKTISIVGTRKATKYGIACCEKLIETIKVFNPTIVSGFAYGIDITAHKAAFKHNLQTIACLAHGFNQIYPRSFTKYNPVISIKLYATVQKYSRDFSQMYSHSFCQI